MRSYNDWMLDDFQGAAPERIVGLPLLPVDDGIDVVRRRARARSSPRARKAVFIPGIPARPYHDAVLRPAVRRAPPRPACRSRSTARSAASRPRPTGTSWSNQKVTASGTVYRFFSAAKPFTYMTYGGVFERHPELKIVAAEVNCRWLPFWAQTMDQNFDNPFYRATGGVRIDTAAERDPRARTSSSPCSTTTSASS